MKVVILAGGLGTRISEESHLIPKPMIEIGGQPILWHIMKIYSHYGFHDFIICCGYKQEKIKEYFVNYFMRASNVFCDLSSNRLEILQGSGEPWRVTLVDTGQNTMTGGRVKRIQKYTEGEAFMLTYGDGVADISIDKLVSFHKSHGRQATLTAVQPESRFGVLEIEQDKIVSFREKSRNDAAFINAGFMVFDPRIFDHIPDGDSIIFEKEPLESLVAAGQLMAYKHHGFWQCMDTQRDKRKLEELWSGGKAAWKVWED